MSTDRGRSAPAPAEAETDPAAPPAPAAPEAAVSGASAAPMEAAVEESLPEAAKPLLGYLSIFAAVAIWAGWIAATRDQVRSAAPLDLSLMRYCLPAVLLAPVWLRKGVIPRGENPAMVAIMALGWGGAFVMLTATGLQTVPASLFGPMVPATLPLFVAVWDRFAAGVRIHPQRGGGLALILCSIALVLVPAFARGDAGILTGAPYLWCAAAGWAAFTIAYRNTTLSGIEATAYVCLWSTPPLLVAAAFQGTQLPEMDALTLGWLALSQAVLSGVCSVACFAFSVRLLGAAKTSAFTSLVPVGAALLGWALLDESPGAAGWAAVVCACLGVAMVNGVFAGVFARLGR